MKKRLFLIISLLAMSAAMAFADFILEAPSVGYSNFLFKGFIYGDTCSANVLTLSFPGLGYQKHNEGGFYFMWNNQLAIAGKQNVIPDEDIALLVLGYKSDFIFGGTIVPIENLYITLGSGLSSGYQSVNVFFGIPLDVGVKYYLTEKVGIMLGLNDTLAIGVNPFALLEEKRFALEEKRSFINFTNQFNIKLGATFRFDRQ